MKTYPNMSDDEWEAFLAAVPEEKKAPIEDYEAFLQKEGVTEEDRLWWNGMTTEEQEEFKNSIKTQNLSKVTHYCNMGMSPSEAFTMMHKTNVVYEDYPLSQQRINELHKFGFGINDYPLPWELCGRIGLILKAHKPLTAEWYDLKEILEGDSSFNAAWRKLLHSVE